MAKKQYFETESVQDSKSMRGKGIGDGTRVRLHVLAHVGSEGITRLRVLHLLPLAAADVLRQFADSCILFYVNGQMDHRWI